MQQDILKKLLKLVAERYKLPLESLSGDDDIFDRLAIDSFQLLELLSVVENEFGVEIPDYELQTVRTLAELAELLKSRSIC